MGVVRFPGLPESGHPQYLWNELEYIVRELFKNRIGCGIEEIGATVKVNLDPETSLGVLTHGAADMGRIEMRDGKYVKVWDFPPFGTDTNSVKWIYARIDGTVFYESTDRPRWHQYLHGWYQRVGNDAGDRAVVFIDAELPQGRRAIGMDSPNSMLEYDTRNPDTGGDLVWEITAPSDAGWQSMLLTPGNYRFELRGGNGGRGGSAGEGSIETPAIGGTGGQGQVIVWKTRITRPVTFFGLLGGNGQDGQPGNSLFHGSGLTRILYVTGGGGGSSGGDTRLRIDDTDIGTSLMLNAMGGAGGGGAVHGHTTNSFTGINGAGGGGAGNPENAQDGEVRNAALVPQLTPGRHGNLQNGGSPGVGTVHLPNPDFNQVWVGNSGQPGHAGTDIVARTRRDGGSSEGIFVPHGNITVNGAAGGSRINGTSGYFRCYRTRDGESW